MGSRAEADWHRVRGADTKELEHIPSSDIVGVPKEPAKAL